MQFARVFFSVFTVKVTHIKHAEVFTAKMYPLFCLELRNALWNLTKTFRQ
jgi:hypothetical protein